MRQALAAKSNIETLFKITYYLDKGEGKGFTCPEGDIIYDKILVDLPNGSNFTILCKEITDGKVLADFVKKLPDNPIITGDRTYEDFESLYRINKEIAEVKTEISKELNFCSYISISQYIDNVLVKEDYGSYLNRLDELMLKGLSEGYFYMSSQGVSMPSDTTVKSLIKDYEKDGFDSDKTFVFKCEETSCLYHRFYNEDEYMDYFGGTREEAEKVFNELWEEFDNDVSPFDVFIEYQEEPYDLYKICNDENYTEGFVTEENLNKEQREILIEHGLISKEEVSRDIESSLAVEKSEIKDELEDDEINEEDIDIDDEDDIDIGD